MPIRDYWRGLGGGDTGRPSRDDRDPGHGPPERHARPEDRSFGADPGFQVEDARLGAALKRHERERSRTRPADYGHDGNFRPGYHEGGSRFGFFPLNQTYGADYASNPGVIDQDFDPDYLHWRAQQLQRHDRDYSDWRRHQCEQYDEEYRRFRAERRDDFHQRFQDWRAQRDAETKASATPPDDKV